MMTLKILYFITTSLCIFMLSWILVFPSSGLQGLSLILDEKRAQMESFATHIPPSLFSKFRGQYAVHLTHTFPGALWSAIIPFQIHPGFRKCSRKIHQLLGYTFAASSVIIMIGLLIILQRKLLFIYFLTDVSESEIFLNEMLQIGLGSWFMLTCGKSIQEARRKNWLAHQYWIIRHIGSGIWIAVMRILLIVVKPFLASSVMHGPLSSALKGKLFSAMGSLAMVSTICLSEYSVRLLKGNQYQRSKRS
jgi:hypothetical protein